MNFPEYRPRRLRKNEHFRRMMRETRLSVDHFIYPLFVRPGKGQKRPVESMPGCYQMSIDVLLEEVERAAALKIPAILLSAQKPMATHGGHLVGRRARGIESNEGLPVPDDANLSSCRVPGSSITEPVRPLRRKSVGAIRGVLPSRKGMRMRKLVSAAFLVACLSPTAAACGICASAMADLILPPVYGWAAVGAAWFLATALVSGVFRTRFPGFPRFLFALLIPVVLLILSGGWGALPFLLLAPASLVPFGMALFTNREPFDRRGVRLSVIAVGICGIVAVLIMASWSYRIHITRTRPDFLIRWSGTGPERSILHKMTKEDPEPLDEYRYLYEHAGLVAASFVAKRIGEIGDPKKDIPFLESRLDDFRAEDWAEMFLEDVEAALGKLESRTSVEGGSHGPGATPDGQEAGDTSPD